MIPIGVKGRIVASPSPDEIGEYVRVNDDRLNTGGYLIFTGHDPRLVKATDTWVLKEDLPRFFDESGWRIEWERVPTRAQ